LGKIKYGVCLQEKYLFSGTYFLASSVLTINKIFEPIANIEDGVNLIVANKLASRILNKLIYTAINLVPGAGLEPARSCPRRILSPLRLPISPPGLVKIN
jgi:hypothetical protein